MRRRADQRGPAGYAYDCLKCGKVIFERLRAVGHASKCGQKKSRKRRGKSKKKLNCNLCSETATTVKKLSEHRRKVHAQELELIVHSCTVCTKTFAHSKNFKVHMLSHKKELGKYNCNLCPSTFNYLRNLKRHKKSHLDGLNFPCEVCHKNFKTSFSLTRHMMSHSGPETRFKCDQCTLEFSRRDHLMRHMSNLHLGSDIPQTGGNQVEGRDEGYDDGQPEVDGGGGGDEPEIEHLSQYDHIRNSNICSITDKIVEHLRSTGSTETQISFFIDAQKKKLMGSMPTCAGASSSPTSASFNLSTLPGSTNTISVGASSVDTSPSSFVTDGTPQPSKWDKFCTPTPTEPAASLKNGFPCTICVDRTFRDNTDLKRHMKSIHGNWVSLFHQVVRFPQCPLLKLGRTFPPSKMAFATFFKYLK